MNQVQIDTAKNFAAYGQAIIKDYEAVCQLSEGQAKQIADLQEQLATKKAVEQRNAGLLEALRAKQAELDAANKTLAQYEPEMIRKQAEAARQKAAAFAAQADQLEQQAAQRAAPPPAEEQAPAPPVEETKG